MRTFEKLPISLGFVRKIVVQIANNPSNRNSLCRLPDVWQHIHRIVYLSWKSSTQIITIILHDWMIWTRTSHLNDIILNFRLHPELQVSYQIRFSLLFTWIILFFCVSRHISLVRVFQLIKQLYHHHESPRMILFILHESSNKDNLTQLTFPVSGWTIRHVEICASQW